MSTATSFEKKWKEMLINKLPLERLDLDENWTGGSCLNTSSKNM